MTPTRSIQVVGYTPLASLVLSLNVFTTLLYSVVTGIVLVMKKYSDFTKLTWP